MKNVPPVCAGYKCTNAADVRIGKTLQLCNFCLEHQRKAHPNSYRRYWQPRIEPLAPEINEGLSDTDLFNAGGR